jgi:hypothetical protein
MTGCIGAIDRADFDAEVRARGGGVSSNWIDESLQAAATELGVTDPDQLQILTLSIDAQNRSLVVTARRGDRPEFVDTVAVRETEVAGTTPLPDADDLPLDDLVTSLGTVPIDRIDELSDTALESFGPDAFVTGVTVERINGAPTITVSVGSERQTGEVLFDATGAVVEVRS